MYIILEVISNGGSSSVPFAPPLQALLFVSERVTYVGTDWWLSVWTSAVNGSGVGVLPTNDLGAGLPAALPMENTHFYMKGYLIFCLTATVFVFGRLHFFASGIGRSTKTLFERLLRGTLGAPMSFFETTPLGRITNRFR